MQILEIPAQRKAQEACHDQFHLLIV